MSNADRVLLHTTTVRECRHAAEILATQHDFDTVMRAATGRPRIHNATTLLTLLLLACDHTEGKSVHLRDAARIAAVLTPQQRQIVGLSAALSESQIYRFVSDLADRELVPTVHGEVSTRALPFTMDELATSLARCVIPAAIPESPEYAIDGTDIEAWANGHRAHEFCEANLRKHGGCTHQVSVDPDARWGYRTASQNQESLFLGYTAHLATDIPLLGEQSSRPPLIRGLAVRHAGSHAGHAGIDVVDELQRVASVEHVLADRAYSNAGYTNWAQPLSERGITQSLDLHPAQIGPMPGPKKLPGTEFIDGTLFSTGMPPRLRRLKRVARFQDKAAHLAAVDAFDERARYAFTPFSEGSKRYRGPAVKGHERVRCPNAPTSMSKTHLPMTNCRPGQPCSCARTITLNDHPRPELVQHFAWGTSDWEADYGRRSLIESVNAGLKTHFASMNRASIRVMGRAKVTFAFGILCAVTNMRLIRERYGDLLDLSGTVDPLPNKNRKPFRARYKSVANPRAGRGRAPTTPLPATMVAPPVARTHE